MNNRLNKGDPFPAIALNSSSAEVLTVLDNGLSDYQIILFFRGHWWFYCRRLLADYEEHFAEFIALNTGIIAASADSMVKAKEVAEQLSFPVAYGVTEQQSIELGAWWENKQGFIQPSEFIIDKQGVIISSTYSSSPIGRTLPEDALSWLRFLESRKDK